MPGRIALCVLGMVLQAGMAGAARFDRWVIVGPGGGGGQFTPTISPHNPDQVLVSCDMTGSYISHDGGGSWRMFNLQGTTKFFLFDPVDAKVIYAKTFGPPASMEKDRPAARPSLFRSADSGRTWRRVHEDSPAAQLTALAADPADSRVLYATFTTPGGALLRVSRDRGATWGQNAAEDAALPSAGERIYVDPQSPRDGRGVYVIRTNSVSSRAGGAWTHGPAPADVRAFLDVAGGFAGGQLIVYGITRNAIHVSADGGRSWSQSAFPGFTPTLRAVATSLNHAATAYVSYSGTVAGQRVMGVAKSTDRGQAWTLVWQDGKTTAGNMAGQWLEQLWGPGWGGNPIALGVDPNDPRLCYATDNGRTVKTADGGRTWKAIYSKPMPDGGWTTTGLDVTTNYGVHFDPFDPQRIFIGYTDIGLFRSENGGRSWHSATSGVPRPWVNTTYWIVFDPKVKGRVWGAMSGIHDLPRTKMWQGQSPSKYIGGACRSEDGARTWDCASDMPQTALTHIVLDPASPAGARVLYATGFGRGVFKSVDDGRHWTLKNDGIAGNEPFAWRLAGDPGRALYVVVARRSNDGGIGNPGDGAVYRSTDGAEHWSPLRLPEGVNGPHGLAVDPQDPKSLYLAAWGRRPRDATVGGGIYLSRDGGASWRAVLDQDQHIGDITIDPRDSRVLYATGFEGNAWRSADRGETWRRIRGFNFKWGQRVIPDPADAGKIYITTYGGSVWHGPALGDPAAVEDIVDQSTARVCAAQPQSRLIDWRLKPDAALARVETTLGELEKIVHRAGEQGCDVLALPEDTLGLMHWEAANQPARTAVLTQAVPRMLDRLGRAAASHRMYLVPSNDTAGPGGSYRNTAFLLGRDGKEIGRYYKVNLTVYESDRVRGETYPVFETPDLGGVGMLICYDMVMPEATRALALGGADIIFNPTLGGAATAGSAEVNRAAFRTRAVDNLVYIVVAKRGGGAMIISPHGEILAEGRGPDGIAVADIDPFGGREGGDALNSQTDMRARLFRERIPSTYGILTDSNPPVLKKIPATITVEEAVRIAAGTFTVGEARFAEAEALLRAGKIAEAASAFRKLIADYPRTWIDRQSRERLSRIEEPEHE